MKESSKTVPFQTLEHPPTYSIIYGFHPASCVCVPQNKTLFARTDTYPGSLFWSVPLGMRCHVVMSTQFAVLSVISVSRTLSVIQLLKGCTLKIFKILYQKDLRAPKGFQCIKLSNWGTNIGLWWHLRTKAGSWPKFWICRRWSIRAGPWTTAWGLGPA